jgi:hypothetical protein
MPLIQAGYGVIDAGKPMKHTCPSGLESELKTLAHILVTGVVKHQRAGQESAAVDPKFHVPLRKCQHYRALYD